MATVRVYTTAPEAYDGFSTRVLDPRVALNYRGDTVRLVELDDADYDWQTGRYRSGAHEVVTESEMARLVEAALWQRIERPPISEPTRVTIGVAPEFGDPDYPLDYEATLDAYRAEVLDAVLGLWPDAAVEVMEASTVSVVTAWPEEAGDTDARSFYARQFVLQILTTIWEAGTFWRYEDDRRPHLRISPVLTVPLRPREEEPE